MPIDPRDTDAVSDDITNRISNKIALLTNFNSGTFNDEWVNSYAEQVHEAEVKLLAAQLSGFIDYAGRDITQKDLNRLGVTDIEPQEVNEYMLDAHLDEHGKLVGVTREQGTKSTGQVTITVSADSVEITEGYEVGTQPKSDGSYEAFLCDVDGDGKIDSSKTVSPAAGENTVTVDVIAKNVGSEYNVGTGAIDYLAVPDPGVESVTNDAETTGGSDVEANEPFRKRIKNAVFENSGGGTRAGMRGYIQSNASTDVDVKIDEFFDTSPPFIDVIVDGGSEAEIDQLIDESRPVGIEGKLVRPSLINVTVWSEIIGESISLSNVTDEIESYLTEIGVGDLFSNSLLTNLVTNSDPNIVSIPTLNTYISEVTDELFTYDGSNLYELEFAEIGLVNDENQYYRGTGEVYSFQYYDVDATSVTVEAIVDDQRTELVSGSTNDFTVIDDDGDGLDDAISLTGNTVPDDGTTMLVSYTHNRGSVADEIVDNSGNTYVKGTDYQVIDNDGDGNLDTIDWGLAGTTPDTGERYLVDYTPRRSFRGDLNVENTRKVTANTNETDVDTYAP